MAPTPGTDYAGAPAPPGSLYQGRGSPVIHNSVFASSSFYILLEDPQRAFNEYKRESPDALSSGAVVPLQSLNAGNCNRNRIL